MPPESEAGESGWAAEILQEGEEEEYGGLPYLFFRVESVLLQPGAALCPVKYGRGGFKGSWLL